MLSLSSNTNCGEHMIENTLFHVDFIICCVNNDVLIVVMFYFLKTKFSINADLICAPAKFLIDYGIFYYSSRSKVEVGGFYHAVCIPV